MHALPRSLLRRCAALLLCAPLAAVANPTGGTVAAGAATITHAGPTTTITQGTDRAVINWNDFNVGAGELTRFVQPGATSAVLNRVTGGNPTQIFGRLEGNGRVFVLNPNGVLVGASGVIQTQGFIGSTLNVADRDFMAGGDLRFTGDSAATVANLGRIDAGSGDAVLIAQRVRNAGEITSGGTAGLAAGNDVLLAREGDTRIWVKSGVAGAGGTGVDHTGTVSAVQAELKAAGGNVYSLAVNSSGLVSATGVTERDGRIYLTSDGGNVAVSGTLQARSAGGRGGEIYVGGGYQGKDAAIANAANTTVTAAAQLDAGGAAETAGKIVVWADGHTNYAGGLQTGRGGQAEVSGKGTLDFIGTVNTRGGRLLLDPTDITIDNSNFAALIGNPLLTGAVTLSATNDITYDTSLPIQSNYTLVWDAGRDVILAPTSYFGSMGAGNNVDFQVYAGRDFIMNAATSIAFSDGGKALIRAGRDITMGASSTISFGTGGWVLLSADTANSSRPAAGPGKITLDSTAYLAAAKIQAFAPSPSQFVNNGMVAFGTPTYDTWEEDVSISSTGSGLWLKSNASGVVGPAITNLTIAANDTSRKYGDPNPDFTATFTGLANGDTPAVVSGLQFATDATLTSRVGTYTITPFGASAPNYYTLSYVPGTLTVDFAELVGTISNATRLYGGALEDISYSVVFTGYKNGETATDKPVAVFLSTLGKDITEKTPVGTYSFGAYGSVANYRVSFLPFTLSIKPAPLTIAAVSTLRIQGQPNPVFAAEYTGLVAGDTAANSVFNLRFATDAGSNAGPGVYTLRPLGALARNYDITYKTGKLQVVPIPVSGGTVLGDTRTPDEVFIDLEVKLAQTRSNAAQVADLAQAVRAEWDGYYSSMSLYGYPNGDREKAQFAIAALMDYFAKNFGITVGAPGYGDFVASLMPAWFDLLRDLYRNDAVMLAFLAQPDAQAVLFHTARAKSNGVRSETEQAAFGAVYKLTLTAGALAPQLAAVNQKIAALEDKARAAAAIKNPENPTLNLTVMFEGNTAEEIADAKLYDELLKQRDGITAKLGSRDVVAFASGTFDPVVAGGRDEVLAAVNYLLSTGAIKL
jgi:filamentous hemagglutinin family protein